MILKGASLREEGGSEQSDIRRILVIQLRRIGDALLGTPALRALAAHLPQAKIDFMAESPTDEVLRGHPLVDRLLVAPRQGSGESWLKFVRKLREQKYDWTIDFFSNPRSAQFAFLSGASVRVGLDRFGRRWAFTHRVVEEPSDRNTYAVDLRLEILRLLGVPAAGRELEIYSDCSDPVEVSRVTELLQSVGASLPLVAVPLTARVIEKLRRKGHAIILTSGPGEGVFAKEILQQLASPVPHLDNARVPTLAALYRHSQLYIGPDSSPKHIAVACGIPTVTIFGPGNPANWNDPQNPRNVVLIAPCETRPQCVEAECAKLGCIGKITPESILRASEQLLPRT